MLMIKEYIFIVLFISGSCHVCEKEGKIEIEFEKEK